MIIPYLLVTLNVLCLNSIQLSLFFSFMSYIRIYLFTGCDYRKAIISKLCSKMTAEQTQLYVQHLTNIEQQIRRLQNGLCMSTTFTQ